MQSVTDIRFIPPASAGRSPSRVALEALVGRIVERARRATSLTSSSPYRMHHDAHLRGPLSDEFRRARWL